MIPIPHPGETVKVVDAITLCQQYGHNLLAKRLIAAQDELPKDWLFDGCSHWFDTYEGFPVYQVCFFHDCAYLVGGEEWMRLEADFVLGLGLVRMTKLKTFTEMTFTGVRVGGVAAWKESFSWGYGKQSDREK